LPIFLNSYRINSISYVKKITNSPYSKYPVRDEKNELNPSYGYSIGKGILVDLFNSFTAFSQRVTRESKG
jgi:hypothetical protein